MMATAIIALKMLPALGKLAASWDCGFQECNKRQNQDLDLWVTQSLVLSGLKEGVSISQTPSSIDASF